MTVRAETEITLARVDDGSDGYSPTATVTKSGDTATITITDKNGTTQESVSDGADGSAGVSVTSVVTEYYLSTSETEPAGASTEPYRDWSAQQQEFTSGNFYWTRDKVTYSDSSITYSTPIYNQGLTLANEYAIDAKISADTAQEHATSAYESVLAANVQLGVVEDIVGVLEMIAKNGEYSSNPTGDVSPVPNKWYFIRSGSGTTADPYKYEPAPATYGYVITLDVAINDSKTYYTRSGSGTAQDPYVYTKVEEPDVADIGTYYEMETPNSLGYYELIGVDESIENYVSSHLVLTDQGLNLQNDKTRLLLSSDEGMTLFDPAGNPIAKYGTTEVELGGGTNKVKITPTAMQFINDNVAVASISSNELKINNARIDNSMRMGNFLWKINTDGRLLLTYSAQ